MTWSRKSQIAIEYTNRLRKECPKIWIFWVHAGSFARFEQSYRAIAAAVRLPGVDESKTDILGLIFRRLESDDSGDWLMILDNADNASVFFSQRGAEGPQMGDQVQHTTALSAYLPQNSRGSILVTSRNRDAGFRLVGREDRIVKVERMGEEGSRRSGGTSDGDEKEIARASASSHAEQHSQSSVGVQKSRTMEGGRRAGGTSDGDEKERVQEQEHLYTLTSMANLALTYRNQGRWKEAEDLEVEVVEMSKEGARARASRHTG